MTQPSLLPPPLAHTDEPLTPVDPAGDYWLKRDDLYEFAGQRGGKVRTCGRLAHRARGLVTAGSRHSPQVVIVAGVGRALGIPVRAHVPAGRSTQELEDAEALGAELVRWRPGYNSVICSRARQDAALHAALGWAYVPFGMECLEAVVATGGQYLNVAGLLGARRIVVPVGSGMSLAGILWGQLASADSWAPLPVLGVVCGAVPTKRLDRWAPPDWRERVALVPAGVPYERRVAATVGGVELDPVYEAKCAAHLRRGDLLWIVGRRG